jgi:RNA polymerase sigma-70 factor, ECF subfamily
MKTIVEPSPELLDACTSGDQAAFRAVFDRYKAYAYNLIYKCTGSRSDHEDLLQEVFFQVYLSLRTFRGASSFTTWFHRVVIQVCTGSLRHKKAAKRTAEGGIVNYDSLAESVPDKRESYASAFELKNLIERAMDGLEDTLRIPLVLSVYSELEVNDIAAIVGIPEGTVKSRLFLARKKMKEFIEADAAPGRISGTDKV